MSNKRAIEMATGTVVTIVLGLVILVILIIFVQQQVKKSSVKYGQFGEEANIAQNKCQSLILGRYCIESGRCKDKSNTDKTIAPPPGGWIDCGKDVLSSKQDCCPSI